MEFIKENYSKLGPEECANKLGRKRQAIRLKAHKMKLKHKEFFNYNRFILDINNPNFIYFLGFCWADGHLGKSRHKYDCGISVQEEDGKLLIPIFANFTDFNVRSYKKEKKKNIISFYSRNQDLCQFLFENDYMDKSYVEPTKILSKIPENLKHYFWRGFFDGDGSITNWKGQKDYHLSVSGQHSYAWTEFTSLLGGKKFNIKRFASNTGSRSVVVLWRQNEVIDFFHYLYPNLKYDIGLFRKYRNFILCLKQFIKTKSLKFKIHNNIFYSVSEWKISGLSRKNFFKCRFTTKKEIYKMFSAGFFKKD